MSNKIKNYFKDYKSRINYTWQHKKAYLKVEKELTSKNTLSGYLHDLDKILMYILFIPKDTVSNIHRKISSHHERNNKIKNLKEAIIDWECARFTKLDKPLNARETYHKYYNNVKGVEEALDKLKL